MHFTYPCTIPAMNNLRKYRKLRGLSQIELGELVGLAGSQISRAESEADSAKLGTFKKCAKELNVTLAQLFADDRSEFELKLIQALRDVPAAKHDELLRLVRLAADQPRVAPE